jgi:hypothetical protein
MSEIREDVKEQENRLAKQQEVINQLVIFSMSEPNYAKLRTLYNCKRDCGEYIYREDF